MESESIHTASECAAKVSSLRFVFESPIPVGELLGQHSPQVEVLYSPMDSLWQFVTHCRDAFEKAFAAGRIELAHWKDIVQRLDSLDRLKHEMVTPSNLITVCNTLGAKYASPIVADLGAKDSYDIRLGSTTNYACVLNLAQECYKAVLAVRSCIATGCFAPTEEDRAAVVAAAYIGRCLQTASEVFYNKASDVVTKLSAEKIMDGFVGVYRQAFYSTGTIDDRYDEFVEYERDLSYYYEDNPTDDEHSPGFAYSTPIGGALWAVFDPGSPLSYNIEI